MVKAEITGKSLDYVLSANLLWVIPYPSSKCHGPASQGYCLYLAFRSQFRIFHGSLANCSHREDLRSEGCLSGSIYPQSTL